MSPEQIKREETDDALRDTAARSLWEKRLERELSDEDLREIIVNLTGLFRLLAEWDRENKKDAPDVPI